MKPIDPSLHWYVATYRNRPFVPSIETAMDLVERIRKVGFDTYLPRAKIQKWSSRGHCYTLVEKPAMDRYFFVGFPPREKHFGMVADISNFGIWLGVDGEPCPVPAEVVAKILEMETDMKFDDTPQSRAKKAGELDDEFPAGMAVSFIADLESVLADMQGEVLGTNGRDKVHVRFGMMKSWLDRKEVRAA
jgi:transcription antitermination factor NusG